MRALTALLLTLLLSLSVIGQNGQTVATPFGPQPLPGAIATPFGQYLPGSIATPFGQQPATSPSGQNRPAGGDSPFPGFPYDPRIDSRLFDSNWVPRVFQLRYVDARWIETLMYPFGAVVSRQDNLNALAVRAPAAVIETIADLIKRMDVPANSTKTVELTCYLVIASPQSGAPESIPNVLKPVVDQLRNVLTYKSYSVVDTVIGRTTEGRALNLTGSASKVSDGAPWPSDYGLQVTPNINGDGADQTVRLEPIRFTGTLESVNPAGTGQQYPPLRTAVNMSTTLDLKKGQQVVVGKSSVRDHALILVISAKVE